MFLRQTAMATTAALLLALPTLAGAETAKKHPKPKHPEAVHPKTQHATPPKATKHSTPKATRHSARKVKAKKRGQMAIDSQRAQQIQEALVREHYLNGEPSGAWDAATQDAMRRYQADQGWQTKEVPDSRALIRLGLGPDHGHLLNPESAMTTAPRLPQSAANTRAISPSYSKSSIATPNSVASPATSVPDISSSR
jgi:peptidoglycan hydrolase-like protein with peptidoglycan-binding domain